MREVGADAANGEWESPAAAASGSGVLKRPSLGPYVGGCRPNALLVATLVKAHGRRRRIDDAARTVLSMADWGLRPDVAVFNSLSAAAVWNGRMDLALEVRGAREEASQWGSFVCRCKRREGLY